MANEDELNKFRSISERIGAHFPEYLLIVKTGDSLLMKASDKTWGIGAADRYIHAIHDEELLASMHTEESEEEQG